MVVVCGGLTIYIALARDARYATRTISSEPSITFPWCVRLDDGESRRLAQKGSSGLSMGVYFFREAIGRFRIPLLRSFVVNADDNERSYVNRCVCARWTLYGRSREVTVVCLECEVRASSGLKESVVSDRAFFILVEAVRI